MEHFFPGFDSVFLTVMINIDVIGDAVGQP